jgi:predicted DNA-binding transcriptional regulator AlpA
MARTSAAQRSEAAGASAQPAALPFDTELWDVHAAARFLKRSVSWVYHRAEDGSLPVRRLGGWGLRFIPGELRAWVESGGVVPARRRE